MVGIVRQIADDPILRKRARDQPGKVMRFVGAGLKPAHVVMHGLIRTGEEHGIRAPFRHVAGRGVEQGACGDQHFRIHLGKLVQIFGVPGRGGRYDGGDTQGFQRIARPVKAADPARRGGMGLPARGQEQMDEGNGGPWLRRRTHGARQDENGQQQDKRQGASECLRLFHKRESCHSGAPPFQDEFSSRSCR